MEIAGLSPSYLAIVFVTVASRFFAIIASSHFNPLSAKLFNLNIFTHLKLCFADAIHNFRWVKIIQIWQNGGQLFSNIAGWCHILFWPCLNGGT